MLITLKGLALEVIGVSWPIVIISIITLSSIRIVYIIKNKKRLVLYKELFSLLFIVYILCLFQVVTFQDVSWSGNNFIPFKEMFRYDFGSGLFYRNVAGNMLLFAPYGFFISEYLKLRKYQPAVILSAIASITIEFTQLSIGRVFDIDDIILNIIGGLLGYICYKILNAISHRLPRFMRSEWFLSTLFVIILFVVIWGLFF